jgi:osmoprotectant transport system ATP-binding protein
MAASRSSRLRWSGSAAARTLNVAKKRGPRLLSRATIAPQPPHLPGNMSTMPSPAVISFERVSKQYDGVRTLDSVTLAVAEREFLAIVGTSGAGKTTLLRLINRLTDPSEGTVRVEGEDVRTLDPIALRRRIGYVFQNVGLFPHMTVAENIAITPRLLGWNVESRAARVDELLDLVRLDRARHRDRFPHQLSGGERQRVGVARALAARPHIVLMDEPFGALDPITRDGLGRDVRALHDELGLTSVMITHDALEAVLLADRIVVMRGGKVIADGTPHALLAGDADPYVRELMQTPRRQAERLHALIAGAGA